MTRRLIVVEPFDELDHALSLMREHQVRRVPVVESHRLVGVIAQADIAALTGSREAAGMLQSVSEPAASQAERRAEEES